MIQLHVDLLQNLQQALFVITLPSTIECSIQTDQVLFESDDQQWKSSIQFNDLIIDVNKVTEVAPPESAAEKGQIRRTFKFPYLRLPKLTDSPPLNLDNLACSKCQMSIKIIDSSSETFRILQQSHTNADEINEIIYCHRFCEAHQHEHKYQTDFHSQIDPQSEAIIIEATDCLILAKKYVSRNLIQNDLVQCQHCSSSLGSIDVQTNLISFDKCSLIPCANDYLSSCFHHHEPGRYIVKVPKCNESIFLVWILPNEILAGDASIDRSMTSSQLKFQRKRKVLFTHVTTSSSSSSSSSDDKNLSEWRRDFSVTTLLVNRLCLEHLAIVFQEELKKFPQDIFQSVNISF